MPHAVIDLLCGIGGLTKGLELAGLNVVAGVDIDESCRFAYEHNNAATFISGDIGMIDSQHLLEYYPENCVKILVGCAPCQPFSKYTQRYRKNGRSDDKWKLLYSFSRLVDELDPSIISMENVPELQKEKVFTDFVDHLEHKGYHCSYSIAFCPDYGVPQRRKRLVLLASKLGDISLISPTHTPNNYRTVRDAIYHLEQLESGEMSETDTIHCTTKLNDLNLERIRQSIPGGTWKDWDERLQLKCHKRKSGKSYGAVYGRMLWDEPSPTITTQFYGYGNGRFGHPEQDRALSYREGALLQSFPLNYAFVEEHTKFNRRELGIHIGNAVPVELGRAIGISIQNHLQEMGLV